MRLLITERNTGGRDSQTARYKYNATTLIVSACSFGHRSPQEQHSHTHTHASSLWQVLQKDTKGAGLCAWSTG